MQVKYTTEASRNRNSCEYQNEKKTLRCDTKKANDTRHLERNTNLSICVFGYCLFAAQNIDEIKQKPYSRKYEDSTHRCNRIGFVALSMVSFGPKHRHRSTER